MSLHMLQARENRVLALNIVAVNNASDGEVIYNNSARYRRSEKSDLLIMNNPWQPEEIVA